MTAFDPTDPTARVWQGAVEVHATPEQVWAAIATGPGIATWFVPATVEEHVDGRITTDHGPFGVSEGRVTTWDPPRRFGYVEEPWDPEHPDAPPWATELLVEARDGGTCVVRLVSGFFTDGEGWEDHLAGTDEGWAAGLRHLQLYLAHFAGLPAAHLFAVGSTPGTRAVVLPGVLGDLGLAGAAVGDVVTIGGDAPAVRGEISDIDPTQVIVRTEAPCPGLLEVGAFANVGGPGDETTTVVIRAYFYGEDGPAVAAADGPRWQAWLTTHVPDLTPIG